MPPQSSDRNMQDETIEMRRSGSESDFSEAEQPRNSKDYRVRKSSLIGYVPRIKYHFQRGFPCITNGPLGYVRALSLFRCRSTGTFRTVLSRLT